MCLKLLSFSELYMMVFSVNKSGSFQHVVRSRISVCLFCLLETTSGNEFMKSFEFLNLSIDILKYLGNIAKKTSSFLGEIFLASKILISRQDLTWRVAEILGQVLAA